MENVFIIGVLVVAVYILLKIVEMKYLEEEWLPMKVVVRDAIMVFAAALTASFMFFNMNTYIIDFFNVVTDTKTINTATTQIFTDDPAF